MPRIDDTTERGVVSTEVLGTPKRGLASAPVGNVGFARGGYAGKKQGPDYYAGLQSIVDKGAKLAEVVDAKQQKADFVRGQMNYASGKTVQEMKDSGASISTMRGYNTLKAASTAERWFNNKVAEISAGDNAMSPEAYNQKMAEEFKTYLGDDYRANEAITAAFAARLPQLAGLQTKANQAYAYEKTKTEYTDFLMQSAQNNSSDDLNQALTLTSVNGLSEADVKKAQAEAAAREAEEYGTTRIMRALQVPTTAQANRESMPLGTISSMTESGGSARTIGRMSTDGRAFGTYQISEKTGTFDSFLKWLDGKQSPMADLLRDKGTREQAWLTLADEGHIQQAESDFIKETHYDPVVRRLPAELQARVEAQPALQEAMFATAVNHGFNAAEIASKVYEPGMSDEEFLDALYEERKTRFGSSTPKERAAVQRSLDKQRDAVKEMLPGSINFQGFSTADASKMTSALKSLRSRNKQTLTGDVNSSMNDIIARVATGDMTPDEAAEAWEQQRLIFLGDKRAAEGGEGVIGNADAEMAVKFGTSIAKRKKAIETENKVNAAIEGGNLQSLSKQELELAWNNIDGDIQRQGQERLAKGSSADDVQEWMLNQKVLAMQKHGRSIDKAMSKRWEQTMLSGRFLDDKGVATMEATSTLVEYLRLKQVSKELADIYVTDPAAKAILNTAATVYETTPDPSYAFQVAQKMLDDGKTVKSIAAEMGSPEYQAETDKAIADAVDDLDPGVFTTVFGNSAVGMFGVSDEQVSNAKASPAFTQAIKMQMAINKQQSPGIDPRVNADMATAAVANRTEFVMGNMITLPPAAMYPSTDGKAPKAASLLADMNMEAYSEIPLSAHDAVQTFVNDNIKEMFPEHAKYGLFDKRRWMGTHDANIMYNATDKAFIISIPVGTDDGRMTTYATIPAADIGDWYKEKKGKELMEAHKKGPLWKRMLPQSMTVGIPAAARYLKEM